jgi:phosphonate transport system permease protein
MFGLLVLLLIAGLWRLDASPERIINGLTKLGWLVALMWPPSAGGVLPELLMSLLESLAMAFLGTVLAVVVALPLALLGAGNVIGNVLLRFSVRRLYDGLRGIDTLIWALIFVAAVGMGPFAGILALAVPDIGTLSKLFSEALESADRRQVEAVRAAGANRVLAVRLGLIPQVAPVMLSQILYSLESNARSSTVLGIVGAGGIGLALADRIRINNWDEVAFIVLLILVMVAAIDFVSRRLRLKIIRAT